MSDIVFMDTETLGLQLDSPIWEIAAIRRDLATGAETELHMFIHHDMHPWFGHLPEEFQRDYSDRFDNESAHEQFDASHEIQDFFKGRPHIVGAVPNFDTERISHQLLRPVGLGDPWHYHLIDIENVVVGYIHGVAARAIDEARVRGESPDPALVDRRLGLPWKSDELSVAVGVDPEQFQRHTAMGDVLWVKAQYDAVCGQ